MLVSKKNRTTVFAFLFKEGVMCAAKDFYKAKHDDVDVPNLEVIKLMQSLESRGYVKTTFNWQWYYWYLTDSGIEYLRGFLHLPAEVVPETHKKPAPRAGARQTEGDRPERGDRDRRGGDRGGFGRGRGGFRGGEGRPGGFREGGYRRDEGLSKAPAPVPVA